MEGIWHWMVPTWLAGIPRIMLVTKNADSNMVPYSKISETLMAVFA